MQENLIKYELQYLISGKSGASYDALIQTVAHYLRSGKRASPMAEEKHQDKAEEAERLIRFAEQSGLFMRANGFVNTRRQDYHHPDLGIIIEDLHDENVLSSKGLLYFIDTVFYIKPDTFWG